MPTKSQRDSQEDKELKALIERAIQQPGVAEAVEVYERTEAIYRRTPNMTTFTEATSNSTAEDSA
jgi:hypothetical protein